MIYFRSFSSKFAVFIVALVPSLVLIGWIIDNPFLTRVLPQFTPMNPITAILFLFTASCLFIMNKDNLPIRRIWFVISGTVMSVVGITILLKYVWGIDLYIDRLLFEPKLGINRMAVVTAFNFLLLGIIILIHPTRKIFSCICKIIIFLIASYALLAYLYNFIDIYGTVINNPIAIHTAFLFVIISTYLIMYDPLWNKQVMETLRKKRLLTPLLLGGIFIVSITVAGGVAFLTDLSLKNQSKLRFENQTNQITSYIQFRMSLYVNAIYGLEGLFAASDKVEKDEWDAYIEEINVPDHYSGISTIAYAARITQEEATQLPFKIYPYSVKDEYYPVTYFKSFVNSSSTVGYDLTSEFERDKALKNSIINDMPTATPVVLTIFDRVPVVFVYAPVYDNKKSLDTVEDRKKATTGLVSVSFRLQKIFPDLFNNSLIDNKINIEIYDTPTSESMQKKTLLYNTKIEKIEGNFVRDTLGSVSEIKVADRIWTVKYTSNQDTFLSLVERLAYTIMLVVGFIFSIVLTLFAAIYIRSRERALLSKNIQLETLVKSFPGAVLIEDENRKMILGNEKIFQIFKIKATLENLIGVPIPDAMELARSLIKDFDAFKIREAEIVAKQQVVADEKIDLENNTYLSRSYIPLFYGDKNHGGMWVYKDITEEQQIDRMKTEFVSLASHQLRTPLTSIKWYAELMSDADTRGKLTKTQKEYMHEISVATDRMVSLVGSLLNVSRLELGTFAIEPVKSDLLEIVGVAVKEAEPNFTLKKQIFTFNKLEKPLQLIIDPKVTHIIIQNLLSNASKYTPIGGTIDLSIKKIAAKGDKEGAIQITCSDTGYGIPIAQQGSVFKKLFRADNVRVLDVEGTGLGLYLVKTVVEAAGCSIGFVSEENKGTTFTIDIPLKGMKVRKGQKTLDDSMN